MELGDERLEDITDISGVRVITYFPDTVDQVASLIEREFEGSSRRSVDKRAALDPDRFGYLSLHHVIRRKTDRAQLGEYKRFAEYSLEVQTRSILQHAWAEIEHDLGYKSGSDVPRELRRRFARLAGLLETADEEFTRIRDDLRNYEERVGEDISASPTQVTLDKASIMAFVAKSDLVRKLDSSIVGFAGAAIRNEGPFFFLGEAEKLARFGIRTIADLEGALHKRQAVVEEFARDWLLGSKHDWLGAGISLFYLWYVLVAETGRQEQIREELEVNSVGSVEERDQLVGDIIDTYGRALAKVAPIDPVGRSSPDNPRSRSA